MPIHPWFRPLAFSPDNERVAIDNGWNIKLVELETGKLMRDIAPGPPLFGNGNAVTSAAITPDGNIIASYEDQVIRVWDRTGARKIRVFGSGPQGERFWDLHYSKQGGWVIGRSQSEIRIWDLETGKVLNRFPQRDPVMGIDLHPKGRLLVTLGRKNGVSIWDARTLNLDRNFPDPTKKIVRVSFTPSGNLLCRPAGIPEFSW